MVSPRFRIPPLLAIAAALAMNGCSMKPSKQEEQQRTEPAASEASGIPPAVPASKQEVQPTMNVVLGGLQMQITQVGPRIFRFDVKPVQKDARETRPLDGVSVDTANGTFSLQAAAST